MVEAVQRAHPVMSGTQSSTNGFSPDIQAFIGPILQGFSNAIHPLFVLLLESTFFTALLVPIILCLLYFSTSTSRKSLMWNLVLFSLLLGLFSGSFSMHVMSKPFVDPINAASVLEQSIALVAIWTFVQWAIDCVLLVRLIAVYPLRHVGLLNFIGILAFPISVKITRLCVTTLFIVTYAQTMRNADLMGMGTTGVLADAASSLPKVEWGLQMADNAYTSALFLWKLRVAFKGEDQGRVTMGNSDSFMARVRKLFWIAASNFVIPVCFDIVLLTIPYPRAAAIYAQLANLYVNLIGVVFATVWSTSHSTSPINPRTPASASTNNVPSIPLASTRGRSMSSYPTQEKPRNLSSTQSAANMPLAVHVKTTRHSELYDA